jgi:hypothetical protein
MRRRLVVLALVIVAAFVGTTGTTLACVGVDGISICTPGPANGANEVVNLVDQAAVGTAGGAVNTASGLARSVQHTLLGLVPKLP